MADDTAEHSEPAPDSGRAKRAPPTIDLEAIEVSDAAASPQPEAEPKRSRSKAVIVSAAIAALSGACAAALVLAAAWLADFPSAPSNAPEQAQDSPAMIEDLESRVGNLEIRANQPQRLAADPAVVDRIEALEKSLASLRGELASLRDQSERLAAAANEAKATNEVKSTDEKPLLSESPAPPDFAAMNERIATLERTTRAQASELAQGTNAQGTNKVADDAPLRRLVAASLLDTSVRNGEPYTAALAAAKSLAENLDTLKPLDGFATSGVPTAAGLTRDLLAQISRLSPPPPESSSAGTGIIDRLKADAAKLVRIERTDSGGNGRAAVLGKVTAAALRNDYAEARRELKTLAPADRAPLQAWIEGADARDAALAASRQFATEAMAALAKPRQ